MGSAIKRKVNLYTFLGEGNGNPLQCSCLENPRDGGAWWATIYGVTQSRTRLKRLSSSSSSSFLESACNAGDWGLIPGSGRSPGEGNGNPLQYSCLENPMDRGAWRDTILGVARVGHDLATKPPPPVFHYIHKPHLLYPFLCCH